jgi:hypothetical protein
MWSGCNGGFVANALYSKFKQKLMEGSINMSSDTIKVVLVDAADYTFSDTHEFLSSVAAGARVGTPQTLGSKSVTNGVFDAAAVNFGNTTGDVCEAILIYKDTGNESTSPLIAYIDTGVTGLPVTPGGGPITITWDTGANKIWKL